MSDHQQSSSEEQDTVPWKRWYALVLISHAVVILMMYLLTLGFHPNY